MTPFTIQNCFQRAGFNKTEKEVVITEEDPDDDVPLARLANLFDNGTTIDEYIAIDDELPATEDVSDSSILQDLLDARSADALHSSEEDDDDDQIPAPKITVKTAIAACDTLRRFLEENEDTQLLQTYIDKIEGYTSRCHFTEASQKTITSFFKAM